MSRIMLPSPRALRRRVGGREGREESSKYLLECSPAKHKHKRKERNDEKIIELDCAAVAHT